VQLGCMIVLLPTSIRDATPVGTWADVDSTELSIICELDDI